MTHRIVKEVDPFDVDERDVLAFGFQQDLETGESIVSAVIDVDVRNGDDPSPSVRKIGVHQIQGTDVLQLVGNGVAGCLYGFRCKATTSAGRVLVLVIETEVIRL